jgi:integrase
MDRTASRSNSRHCSSKPSRIFVAVASASLVSGCLASIFAVHPKVVQEAMGHANISVTLDLYSHVVPTLQRDAAREMGVALLG